MQDRPTRTDALHHRGATLGLLLLRFLPQDEQRLVGLAFSENTRPRDVYERYLDRLVSLLLVTTRRMRLCQSLTIVARS
jgi:hypothetical protein